MRKLLLAGLAVAALVFPAVADAKTTKVSAYSTLDDRPGRLFRTGDTIHVLAHNFIPDAICGARAKFTLVDSAGHSFIIGRAHPGFGNWGEGVVNRDFDPVPATAAPGPGKVKSKQECGKIGTASGDTRVVIIDPSRPLPQITSTAAPDALSSERAMLTLRLDRDAEVTAEVQYEFVAGDWRSIDTAAERKYFDDAGSYEVTWKADLGGPVPPGHYRFVATPRAPTVGNGQPVVQDFYVARRLASGLSNPTGIQRSPAGVLTVAESAKNRLVAAGGGVVDAFNLTNPRDIAFSGTGPSHFTYIANAGTKRVLRHQRLGNVIEASLFAGPEYFSATNGPLSVAATELGGGRVYAVDGDNPRVQAFDLGGASKATFTAPAGVLDDPTGVAVASDGSVWVADPTSVKLVHFSPLGALLAQVSLKAKVVPRGVSATPKPVALDVDASGRVVYGNETGKRVSVLAPDGTAVATVGAGLLAKPAGVAAAGLSGDFFVVDSTPGRVLWFRVP